MGRLRSRLLTILIIGFALMAIFSIISMFFQSTLLIFIFTSFLGFLYFYLMYYYYKRMKGIDRFVLKGQDETDNLLRVIILFVISLMVFAVVNQFLPSDFAFIITYGTIIGVVVIVDQYVGRDMEEYIESKKRSHSSYVNSLGTADTVCQSCRSPKSASDEFCPSCGFKHKEVSDTDYISKR